MDKSNMLLVQVVVVTWLNLSIKIQQAIHLKCLFLYAYYTSIKLMREWVRRKEFWRERDKLSREVSEKSLEKACPAGWKKRS